jgi:hypothetical protein
MKFHLPSKSLWWPLSSGPGVSLEATIGILNGPSGTKKAGSQSTGHILNAEANVTTAHANQRIRPKAENTAPCPKRARRTPQSVLISLDREHAFHTIKSGRFDRHGNWFRV